MSMDKLFFFGGGGDDCDLSCHIGMDITILEMVLKPNEIGDKSFRETMSMELKNIIVGICTTKSAENISQFKV